MNKKLVSDLLSCAALLVFLNSTETVFGASAQAGKQVINPFTESGKTAQNLEANRQKQVEAAKSWKVFHDFQFENRGEQSGINFEMQPVDDASKNYLAVHYDHGTGLAVADVDNDGKLDLYFINQRGGNQ